MPGETDVIQHRVKRTYDTPVRCKPYPLPYSMREKLRNEVGSMLEMVTDVDLEPMITAENLFRRLSGMKYLSKIDLTKGYWQIPVAPEDVYKTAFVTPDGVTLVRRLKKVLKGLSGVGSYIDDIVIYSDSWEEHLSTVSAYISVQ